MKILTNKARTLTTIISFTLGLILNSSLQATGDIEEAPTLGPIVKYFENFDARINPKDSHKIVAWDVDHVLLMPSDQCLHPKYREETNKEMKSLLDGRPLEDYWSHVLETHPREYVDSEIIPFLDSLKERELKTIGFTNAPTGAYGHYSHLEKWRMDELKAYKLDFSYSFPEKPYIEFKQIKTKDPNKFPLFMENVLFSCLLPKGEVVSPFLRAIGGSYDEIISIDDKLEELTSEMNACETLGIKFKGFHYTAALNKPVEKLNETRMKYQIRTLLNTTKWLSDGEADQELLFKK